MLIANTGTTKLSNIKLVDDKNNLLVLKAAKKSKTAKISKKISVVNKNADCRR